MPDDLPPDRTLRLAVDYNGFPLWDTDGGTDGVHLGLTPELYAALEAWQENFDNNFHWERGWASPEAAATHAMRGPELLRWLETELPDCYIELFAWPAP